MLACFSTPADERPCVGGMLGSCCQRQKAAPQDPLLKTVGGQFHGLAAHCPRNMGNLPGIPEVRALLRIPDTRLQIAASPGPWHYVYFVLG